MDKKTLRKEPTSVNVQNNIETILQLDKEAVQHLSTADHIADKVRVFAGSTPFILLHILWFGGWILINSGIISTGSPFDPFPFNFLTLTVSLEAIFLTLLVLKSQNQMTKEADRRTNLDLQINMLDEQETTMILRMVQKIATHLGLEDEMGDHRKELSEDTDINKVAKTLDENQK